MRIFIIFSFKKPYFFALFQDVFPDKATERKILSLAIKCPSEGCDWTGELRGKKVTSCQLMSGIVKLNQSCFLVIVLITSTPEGLLKYATTTATRTSKRRWLDYQNNNCTTCSSTLQYLYISLPSSQGQDVKQPNLMFYPQPSTPEGFAHIWQGERVRLIAQTTLGPFIRGKIRRGLYHLYEHVLSNKTRLG